MPWSFKQTRARNGQTTLCLQNGAGEQIFVHSPLDPVREAQRILSTFSFDNRPILLLLGGGLGTIAKEAANRNLEAVIQLEPPQSRMGVRPVAQKDNGPRQLSMCGNCADLVEQVTREQIESGYPDILLVVNAAYQRAFPDWASRFLQHFQPGLNPSALRKLRNRTWEGRRVLVIQSGYFLLKECVTAFKEVGCDVVEVPLGSRDHIISPTIRSGELKADPDFLNRLLGAIASSKPDFVFTVNHIGFDTQGKLLDLLDGLQLPVVSWYVDSPVYILDGQSQIANERSHLFVWERHWQQAMQGKGFASVDWLPLAGNRAFEQEHRPSTKRDLSFVAGSNVQAIAKWQAKLALPERLNRYADKLQKDWLRSGRGASLEHRLTQSLKQSPMLAQNLNNDQLRVLESLLVLKCTQQSRLDLVNRFKNSDFSLHGDEGWKTLDRALPLKGPLEYYTELPTHYAENRINLNCTSWQMPTALNQRAFDVPLTGSLVLGDWQEDLELLFEPGKDYVAWHNLDEAESLVDELLRDTRLRHRIAEAGRATVVRRHLYRHRIAQILETLKNHYGTGATSLRSAGKPEESCVLQ